jgi:hypothetical protein
LRKASQIKWIPFGSFPKKKKKKKEKKNISSNPNKEFRQEEKLKIKKISDFGGFQSPEVRGKKKEKKWLDFYTFAG